MPDHKWARLLAYVTGLEALIVRFARENSGWGYDRIVGALPNLGHPVSDVLAGTDFFTVEVLTWSAAWRQASTQRHRR